jgi:hypothetical protein
MFILTGIGSFAFAWFFEYAIAEVPYLKWYGKLLDRLPNYLADPLGKCPYCFGTWLVIAFYLLPQYEVVFNALFSIGVAYVLSVIYSRTNESKILEETDRTKTNTNAGTGQGNWEA